MCCTTSVYCCTALRCLGPEDVMSILVEGVEEALEKNSDGVSKGVKAHFEMNANGVLVLNSVSVCVCVCVCV